MLDLNFDGLCSTYLFHSDFEMPKSNMCCLLDVVGPDLEMVETVFVSSRHCLLIANEANSSLLSEKFGFY